MVSTRSKRSPVVRAARRARSSDRIVDDAAFDEKGAEVVGNPVSAERAVAPRPERLLTRRRACRDGPIPLSRNPTLVHLEPSTCLRNAVATSRQAPLLPASPAQHPVGLDVLIGQADRDLAGHVTPRPRSMSSRMPKARPLSGMPGGDGAGTGALGLARGDGRGGRLAGLRREGPPAPRAGANCGSRNGRPE